MQQGLDNSALDWGDYDNDGDLDLLIGGDAHAHDPGQSGGEELSIIYRNEQGCQTDVHGGGIVDVDDLTAVIRGWGVCP